MRLFYELPWEEITFAEWVQISISAVTFITTIIVSVLIFVLQSRNEKKMQRTQLADDARQFLIEHKDERVYLPWCVMASDLYRMSSHSRKIYSDFCQCSDSLQLEILHQAEYDHIPRFDKQTVMSWIEALSADVVNYRLGENILYNQAKYFFRAMEWYYNNQCTDELVRHLFSPIYPPSPSLRAFIRDDGKLQFLDYVEEYLRYMRDDDCTNQKDGRKPTPPIDYMIEVVNWRIADESVVCMWTMETVFDICCMLEHRNHQQPNSDFPFVDADAEFFEDKFYESIQMLYQTYGELTN